jgi:glycosyltransferase involved in cell wall biosynthesis
MRGTPLRISILVPCRNERNHIRPFIRSLSQQDLSDFEWEILIAEGMSDDGTRAIVEEHAQADSRIRIVDNPDRIVSTGLNAALSKCRGEIVLRMDVHTEYAPDYVRQCVAELLRTGAGNVGGPARTKAVDPISRAIAAAYHSRFSCGGARFHDPEYEGYVDTVTYGCWRRDTLERLGGFDESLVRNQDDELNMRLIASGEKIWQSPRIRSWYHPRSSLRHLFRQYGQYGFWKVAVLKKHPRQGSWRHFVPAVFVAANLFLPTSALLLLACGFPQVATAAALCWGLGVAAYVGAVLSAAMIAARRFGWDLFPVLPAAFTTYHAGYGAGFLAGCACFLMRRDSLQYGASFIKLTR